MSEKVAKQKVTDWRLRHAIKLTAQDMPVSLAPMAFRFIVWELMKAHTKIGKLERTLEKARWSQK